MPRFAAVADANAMDRSIRNSQIKDAYLRGESLFEVGNSFDLSHEMVRLILKRQKVELRRQGKPGGLSPDQLQIAKRRYAAGASTHQISRELSVAQETVRSALIFAGVTLRSPSAAIKKARERIECGDVA